MNRPFSVMRSTILIFLIMAINMYGCMALFSSLSLYLVHHLGLSDSESVEINAAFSALQFAFAIIGGEWGARFGHRNTAFFGGVMLVTSMLLFLVPVHPVIPLSFFIIGLGSFIPNSMICLGQLFEAHDAKRTAAYTFIYLGMNIGAMLGIVSVSWLINQLGWEMALASGAVGFLIALLLFLYTYPRLPFLPATQCAVQNQQRKSYRNKLWLLILLSIVGIAVFRPLLTHYTASEWFMGVLWLIGLGYIVLQLAREPSATVRRSIVFLILMIIVVSLFFIPYYLEITVLPLVTDSYVNKTVFGHTIPAIAFLGLNPAFNMIIGVLMLVFVWRRSHSKSKSDWRIYGGVMFAGFALVLLALVILKSDYSQSISALWLLPVYFFLCLGEMMAVPVLYAVVTEFGAPQLQGIFMGMAQLAGGMGAIMCGALSTWMMGGAKSALQLTHIEQGLWWSGVVITVIGFVLWVLAKPIRRLFNV